MASASHASSPAATATYEPAENKMHGENQSTEKETSALDKDYLSSVSTEGATEDGQMDHPPAADAKGTVEPQIELRAVPEQQAVNTVEARSEEHPPEVSFLKEIAHQPSARPRENRRDEHDDNKAEQLKPKESAPVNNSAQVPEKDIRGVVEAADNKGQENSGVESVALEVQELPSFEFAETEQEEHPMSADASESTHEARGKGAAPVEVQPVKDGSVETAEAEIKDTEADPTEVRSKTTEAGSPEIEAKLEAQPAVSKQVDTASSDVKTSVSEIEIQLKERLEITGKADSSQESEVEPMVKLEDRTSETHHSVISSKGEKSSEQQKSSPKESSEQVILCNKDTVIELKKEVEEAPPAEDIEKISPEEKEKYVVDEPPNDSVLETKGDKENVSEDKDVVTKGKSKEDENIKKNTEPAADDKCTETAREIAIESKEKENAVDKPDEVDKEKLAKVAETAVEITKTEISNKDSGEQKQPTAVTTKEVAVKSKHSNNIISKVKQSLVKAKKAIIGKSLGTKTLSTEAKGEIKVK